MQMRDAINAVMRREDLSFNAMHALMRQIMTGEASDAQIGGLLVGLAMKGESAEEISAAAQVMRDLMKRVELHTENVVDIVGTGGDGANLFNVSTASSFVAAAGGAHVAKHGNRSVSSSSGSADLFDIAGIYLDLKPEQVAFPASLILSPLLKLLYPFVWVVNIICNGLLRMLGFNAAAKVSDHLSSEELRTIVHEAGALIPLRNQSMLLSILDLDTVTVEDIMIPRNEIVGIDINDDISTILNTISQSPHTRLPLYQEELNNVVGIVHVRQILPLLYAENPSKEEFLALAREPYFVPESTPLNTQLLNFQKRKYWVALVVDEYGDIQGLTTLEDILEEIVGDMAEEQDHENEDIHPQEDGSFFIDGTTTVRDINKALIWTLPIDGPKTLNGLITERLEEIPQFNVCLKMGEYHLETVQIRGNFIKTVRLSRVETSAEEVH